MMDFKIPGSPLPPKLMLELCIRSRWIGSKVSRMMPWLDRQLKQSDMNIPKEIYGAAVFVTAAWYFLIGALCSGVMGLVIVKAGLSTLPPEEIIKFALFVGVVAAGLISLQVSIYPSVMLGKKVRDLERNLVFALRTILVEVRSGVTLFDAIQIAAHGENGQVSKEFKKAIDKINTGSFQTDALEDMAENNPSVYFRRAIWQLVSGLKAGSDVSVIMESLVDSLSKEKANQVRKYGNSLKLLSLLYMMLGAIMPALGLTLLIILSTFPQVKLGEHVFWGMLVFLLIGQFMFLGIIKNSRPSLLSD